MSSPNITLYVDAVSPFAYIVYHILRNCDITYVPVFLGGLFKLCGNTAPLSIKNKDKWINKERIRWSTRFNVPMRDSPPPNFPIKSLHIMRCLAYIQSSSTEKGSAKLATALDALYPASFHSHEDITDPAYLERTFTSLFGAEDAKKVMEGAKTEGKEALGKYTDVAFADGAFGLPWLVCENSKGQKEGFWGVDHLGQVIEFLGLRRPSQGGWKPLL